MMYELTFNETSDNPAGREQHHRNQFGVQEKLPFLSHRTQPLPRFAGSLLPDHPLGWLITVGRRTVVGCCPKQQPLSS